MEKPAEGPNALLHCLTDNMPNAHAAQPRTHYKTKRAEILAYAQQHEDTYKRRVRIDAGAETEAKRTEAWQAWTQNITKISHPLDELEADILGAMGHCLAIGMWNSSQKQPTLVIYSRGGGEKLIQIDAKQRPAEIEHFPVRLGQNYYARVTRRRATLNSFPVTAPATPTNEDPTVIEDAAAPTLREERPGGDEVQSAASRTLNHSAGATRRAAEVGTEHPDEMHTALRAQLNPEEEAEVAAAYRILQTFRLPTPATGPKRRKRKHHGRPTAADYFGTLDGEHQQQTGAIHAEAQSGTPDNGGTSDQGAEPQRNQLNAGLLRRATEGAADPAAAADQDVESDRVDDPGDDDKGHDWGTGREDIEGRSGDRGCSDSAKRGDSSDGSGSGSGGGGDCGGSDSGSGDSGGNDGSSTERGDGNGGSSGGGSGGSGSGSGGGGSGSGGEGSGSGGGGSGSGGGGSDSRGGNSGGETGAALSAETVTVTAAVAAAAAAAAGAATAAATVEVAAAKAVTAAASTKSVSAGTHNRAGGDGNSDDGGACDSNGARGDSSGRGGIDKGRVGAASGLRSSGNEIADASGGHIGKTSEDEGHGGETRRYLQHQRGATTAEEQETPTRRGSASDMGTMGQPPENYATRCDEAATLHTNPATPRAEAEVDEEVESGETAAAGATNDMSDTRRRARGKKRGGQQSRLPGHARKRYRKSLDKT